MFYGKIDYFYGHSFHSELLVITISAGQLGGWAQQAEVAMLSEVRVPYISPHYDRALRIIGDFF